MECEDLIVYRLTMAFVQSPRPILVMSAERISSLLIYILINLTAVDICHPTTFFGILHSLVLKCASVTLWVHVPNYEVVDESVSNEFT